MGSPRGPAQAPAPAQALHPTNQPFTQLPVEIVHSCTQHSLPSMQDESDDVAVATAAAAAAAAAAATRTPLPPPPPQKKPFEW